MGRDYVQSSPPLRSLQFLLYDFSVLGTISDLRVYSGEIHRCVPSIQKGQILHCKKSIYSCDHTDSSVASSWFSPKLYLVIHGSQENMCFTEGITSILFDLDLAIGNVDFCDSSSSFTHL
ncbi:hypothetical protein CHS0354_028583 [Potamilus streckersoni]|uniref:Uncharacterized protein n=1 Tax=Potamilus streckersoni TaxID=2493646 RepID=A0AAE0SP90_9BIVA|nr:hypothetical protein CHS0354_028583 [Potamilus streckersoni]